MDGEEEILALLSTASAAENTTRYSSVETEAEQLCGKMPILYVCVY